MLVNSSTSHWPPVLKRIIFHDFSLIRNHQKFNFHNLFTRYIDYIRRVDVTPESILFSIQAVEPVDLVELSTIVEVNPEQLIKDELRLIVSSTYEQLQLLIEEDKFNSNTNRNVAGRRLRILVEIYARKPTEDSNS